MAEKKPSFRFFRKKDSAEEDAAPRVRKAKSFKRIRGLLKGESRKERKSKKEIDQLLREGKDQTTPASAGDGDDESTVYNVDVDDRSVASRPHSATSSPNKKDSLLGGGGAKKEDDTDVAMLPADAKKSYLLKVVLLLMDPESRRFELLQLEFDSLKALVSDVLTQIPVSVTEEALRSQAYTGICGREGKEMTPEMLLATFCKGNDVLVAIPSGLPAKECARLARPILSDDKVITMLASSGIDAQGWKEDAKKKKKKSKSTAPTTKSVPRSIEEVSVPEPTTKKTSGGSLVFSFGIVIMVAMVLQVFHLYISAPIKPGHVVSPGIWLSKCGALFFLPSCEAEYLHVGKDGIVKTYNAEMQVVWEIKGAICAEEDQSCTKGMQFNEDGSIVLGGKVVPSIAMYSPSTLTPWPFAAAPKVRMLKKY